ncbi:copper resistance protein CopC [Isoptericola sp. b490]|uniref:copper resistance CopC family protein n=1 Tax=Actinotalea lenta TaxID=3064654 RepID=UPI00271344A9|nr:copper resistance CopC family protein [Isoptericola sp. b490]MDO8120454.1 copper resistance protein CopC [Isoptericola sp. b490]
MPVRPARPMTAMLLAGLALIGLAGPARAHDQLVGTDPADGAVVDAVPSQVALTFSEDVLDISTTVVVAGPDGRVPTTPTVDGGTVTAPLPDGLPDGPYTVTWRVVSADGHPVQGSFAFTVGAFAATPSPSAAPAPGTTAPATPTGLFVGIGIAVALAVALVVARRAATTR